MSFDHGVPTGPLASGRRRPTRPARRSPSGPTRHLRDDDYDFETIRARFQQMAFLNKGLRINLVDERVRPRGRGRRAT
jgi:DNA gyrase subunit B